MSLNMYIKLQLISKLSYRRKKRRKPDINGKSKRHKAQMKKPMKKWQFMMSTKSNSMIMKQNTYTLTCVSFLYI